MTDVRIRTGYPVWARVVAAFVAGFLATLIFHQLTLVLLRAVQIAPMSPFSMAPTSPFGVPAVFSLAFWGGIWGILYAFIDKRFPPGAGYWASAFLFGAIFPTLVAMLIVLPLKGLPVGGGWKPTLLITAFLINGAWGIGTGLILKLLLRRSF
ncbi:MAG: hypothetical protein M8357_09750 [Desulfobulbaceae bacterium]|nr:hypothetical protein [Desulfobulbaceae bacterium]